MGIEASIESRVIPTCAVLLNQELVLQESGGV